MKKNLILTLALVFVLGIAGTAFANPYSDVPAGHWAYKAVNDLHKAGIMEGAVEENFAQEGRPKWMGLSPKTLKRKKGDKILQESGQLASSIQQGADRTSAFVGSNKVYAAIQNNGGKIERAAYSTKVRHRTDAKGNLLRTEHFNGKGLVFAKDSHKRAMTRWFEVGAHSFSLPSGLHGRNQRRLRRKQPSFPAQCQKALLQMSCAMRRRTVPAAGTQS